MKGVNKDASSPRSGKGKIPVTESQTESRDAPRAGHLVTAGAQPPRKKPKWLQDLESGAIYLNQYMDATQKQMDRVSSQRLLENGSPQASQSASLSAPASSGSGRSSQLTSRQLSAISRGSMSSPNSAPSSSPASDASGFGWLSRTHSRPGSSSSNPPVASPSNSVKSETSDASRAPNARGGKRAAAMQAASLLAQPKITGKRKYRTSGTDKKPGRPSKSLVPAKKLKQSPDSSSTRRLRLSVRPVKQLKRPPKEPRAVKRLTNYVADSSSASESDSEDNSATDSNSGSDSDSGSGSGSGSDSNSDSDSGSGSDSDSTSESKPKSKSHAELASSIKKPTPLISALLDFITPSWVHHAGRDSSHGAKSANGADESISGSESDSGSGSDSDSGSGSAMDSDSGSDSDSDSGSTVDSDLSTRSPGDVGPHKDLLMAEVPCNSGRRSKSRSKSPHDGRIPPAPPLPPAWWWRPEDLLPTFSRHRPPQLNWDPRFVHSCDVPLHTIAHFGAPVFFEMPLPCSKEYFLTCHDTPTDLHNPLHEAAMVMDMWMILLAKSHEHQSAIASLREMYEKALEKEDFISFQKTIMSFAMVAHQARPFLDFETRLPSDMVHELINMTYRRIVSPYARSLNNAAKAGRYDRVYGELLSPILSHMFRDVELRKGDVFVDMGSGVGNVVLQAALETGADCVGCEIVERAGILAHYQQQELQARTRAWGVQDQMGEVQFYLGDMTTCPPLLEALTRASVVMCNNKVFDNQLNAKLVSLFRKHLRPGTRVISLEKFANDKAPVRAEKGIVVAEYQMPPGSCSWTEAGGRYFVTTFLNPDEDATPKPSFGMGRIRLRLLAAKIKAENEP